MVVPYTLVDRAVDQRKCSFKYITKSDKKL